jgi:polysaccharide biosynthesis/export protein
MPKSFLSTIVSVRRGEPGPLAAFLAKFCLAVAAAILLLAAAGCQTPQIAQAPPASPSAPVSSPPTAISPFAQNSSIAQSPAVGQPRGAAPVNAPSLVPEISTPANSLVLQPGDAVQVTFPGAPTLNRTVAIRRDGKISLELIGDIDAAGLTPNQLEKVLLDKYGPMLVVKEVNVSVVTAAFIVYVTGAVSHPGKVASERVLTPLQAVIEAGIDTQRANLKSVKVIRADEHGHNERFKLNLKNIMLGKEFQPFTLRPLDIIVVPEKFTWF